MRPSRAVLLASVLALAGAPPAAAADEAALAVRVNGAIDRAAANLIVVKLEQLGYYCYFRARLSDLAGKPLPRVVASNDRRDPKRR